LNWYNSIGYDDMSGNRSLNNPLPMKDTIGRKCRMKTRISWWWSHRVSHWDAESWGWGAIALVIALLLIGLGIWGIVQLPAQALPNFWLIWLQTIAITLGSVGLLFQMVVVLKWFSRSQRRDVSPGSPALPPLELFHQAIAQLGHTSLPVRVGVLHSLQHLTNTDPSLRWQVIDILSAFIQTESVERRRLRSYTDTRAWTSPQQPDRDIQRAIAIVLNLQGRSPQGFLDLSGAYLEGANLGAASLVAARLRRVTLNHALLFAANLQEADLWEAHLQQADLTQAHLTGALLNQAQCQGVKLRDAQLDHADFSHAHLHQAQLQGASLRQASLDAADFTQADLSHAMLQAATLEGTILHQANLAHAQLQKAQFRRANLSDANLKNAQLDDADLFEADLHRANLHGADLQHVRNLLPYQVRVARNWQYARYDTMMSQALGLTNSWQDSADSFTSVNTYSSDTPAVTEQVLSDG
jgi:uncharacterized protein YjbI with pentapeptide repeats